MQQVEKSSKPSGNDDHIDVWSMPYVRETEAEFIGYILAAASRHLVRWQNWDLYGNKRLPKPDRPAMSTNMQAAIDLGLLPEDFSIKEYRKLFTAMTAAFDLNDGRCDPFSVMITYDALYPGRTMESLKIWFGKLMDGVQSGIFNCIEYCRIIRESAIRRKFIIDAGGLAESGATAKLPELRQRLDDLRAEMDDRLTSKESKIVNVADATKVLIAEIEKPSADKQIQSISSGFPVVDEMVGGFRPGELILIAGRPRSGKTSLALKLCHTAAENDFKVTFFSLEMPLDQIIKRQVSVAQEIPFRQIETGMLTQSERAKIHWYAEQSTTAGNINNHWLQSPTIDNLISHSREVAAKHGVDMIVIDQLSKILPGERKMPKDRLDMQMGEYTDSLQKLALELNVPVILLAQNSRKTETRTGSKPRLEDIFNSDRPAQDCSTILAPWRQEFFANIEKTSARAPDEMKSKPNEDAFLCVLKSRNGLEGDAPVVFHGPTMAFCLRGDESQSRAEHSAEWNDPGAF